MNTRKKISIIFLCLTVSGAVYLWHQRLSRGHSIPPYGGESFSLSLSEIPFYLQTDSEWADDKIGGSQESIARVGCTICCISMGLAEFGVDLDPNQLNQRLKENDGYTDRGWIIWDSVSSVTDNKVEVEVVSKVDYPKIDTAIQHGNPVIAKVYINNVVTHWVLVIGKDGNEYLIKDPLANSKKLEKLSKYDSNIYAVRILKQL